MTLRECEAACASVKVTSTARSPRLACGEEPAAGPCRGQVPRYYHDLATRTCQQFLYGGCAGNRNNFVSVAECEATCGGYGRDTCGLQVDRGPCSNYQTR